MTTFRDTLPTTISIDNSLHLEKSNFRNGEETVALIQASIGTLSLFFPWATKDYNINSFLEWKQSVQERDNVLEYDYKLDEILIGRFAIRLNSYGLPEFGYWLGSAYEGHGYITKAIQATLPILKELGYRQVEVNYLPNNQRSRATALRNGFQEIGLETTHIDFYPEGTIVMRAILNLE